VLGESQRRSGARLVTEGGVCDRRRRFSAVLSGWESEAYAPSYGGLSCAARRHITRALSTYWLSDKTPSTLPLLTPTLRLRRPTWGLKTASKCVQRPTSSADAADVSNKLTIPSEWLAAVGCFPLLHSQKLPPGAFLVIVCLPSDIQRWILEPRLGASFMWTNGL
jgi:hypothetical protein